MLILKRLSNLIFGTHFNTNKFVMPSKELLIRNMYREFGTRDWW
ncbi:MAG: hypothetical protein V4605_08555 [Pseudomonadota bacterium]